MTWHDGKPFTAKDVICTFDKLQEKALMRSAKIRASIWWHNLKQVVAQR